MTPTFEKALLLGLLIVPSLGLSVRRLAKATTPSALLQLLGSGFLVVVVLTHFAEAFHILPSMGWGESHSVGHYIDLLSAIVGLAFLFGAFVMWFARRSALGGRR